ncbi:IS66 family insertion sequence hypothetical protein [Paucibacter sp. KBW04]|uniref:transposase n=1 Tax=Paucibacter sp. KBW04 TaxID=2153361 RepID=UPI000F5629DA|nr:IS66 family insertion sequence hypothetical protein [Paucibacter sp. KBW04]
MEQAKSGRRRRTHSEEFKARVVQASTRPGVSLAAVAMAHGINANLLRRWVLMSQSSTAVTQRAQLAPLTTYAGFVPVPMPAVPAEPAPIRIDVQRGSTTIAVSWPTSAADALANDDRSM